MSDGKKNHVVYVDKETHYKISILAAIKSMPIKKYMKELVEKAEKEAVKNGN